MKAAPDRGAADSDRRQSLAQAALDEIATKGLEGLRLRHVAAIVGIDHSTILHYFATKEDLLAAVAELATRPFWGTTPRDGKPQDRLQRHLETLAKMIVKLPRLHLALRELDLRAARDPAVAAIISGREDGWRKSLLDVFESGMPEGVWGVGVQPQAAVELVIATVKGASLKPRSATHTLRQLASLLIRSTQPPSKRPAR